ncbi:hypothetical protein ADIS_1593 [Lunatimonas lonarensis]|uniref:Uncharacterized protein n=1 Tax=Lunatimonas lonarensis TaxID=1232681 RepID=R7ZUQ1_9BACT|nr:hypothetical protein ADIS_1593 [Lunatimonas lonarensis]
MLIGIISDFNKEGAFSGFTWNVVSPALVDFSYGITIVRYGFVLV